MSLEQQLSDAIKANSMKLVKMALEAGADSGGPQADGRSPLEKAVDNVSENYGYSKDAECLRILDKLLAAGVTAADRDAAIKQAVHLRQAEHLVPSAQRSTQLEKTITKIQVSAPLAVANMPKSLVARSTVKTWKSLLFSEEFSDVKFVFPDGSALYAHRCVLAAASPYFSEFFKGPWGEQGDHDGEWKTTNSKEVMKAVLTFIYVGEFDASIMQSHWAEMLSVTDQYDLEDLQELTEQRCIDCLNLRTVKMLLQAAHLHNSKRLKLACFDLIRRKAARVLADPKIMSLQDEDPDLWAELVAALKQGG